MRARVLCMYTALPCNRSFVLCATKHCAPIRFPISERSLFPSATTTHLERRGGLRGRHEALHVVVGAPRVGDDASICLYFLSICLYLSSQG